MKLMRGSTVTWPSRYNKTHVFKGVILRVIYQPDDTLFIEGIAVVDDGSGLTPRCIPQKHLTVVTDPTRIKGIRK